MKRSTLENFQNISEDQNYPINSTERNDYFNLIQQAQEQLQSENQSMMEELSLKDVKDAVKNGHTEILMSIITKFLKEKNMPENIAKYAKSDAIVDAADNGHTNIVSIILKLDDSLGKLIPPKTIDNAFWRAIQIGHTETVQCLLRSRETQISNDSKGKAFELAAVRGDVKTMYILADLFKNISFYDKKFFTLESIGKKLSNSESGLYEACLATSNTAKISMFPFELTKRIAHFIRRIAYFKDRPKVLGSSDITDEAALRKAVTHENDKNNEIIHFLLNSGDKISNDVIEAAIIDAVTFSREHLLFTLIPHLDRDYNFSPAMGDALLNAFNSGCYSLVHRFLYVAEHKISPIIIQSTFQKIRAILDKLPTRNIECQQMLWILLRVQGNYETKCKERKLRDAVKSGDLEIVKSLLNEEGSEKYYRNEIIDIAEKEDTSMMLFILDSLGTKISNRENTITMGSAIQCVAQNGGHSEMLELLLTRVGTQINPYIKGCALRNAVKNGHTEMVKVLLRLSGNEFSPDFKKVVLKDAKNRAIIELLLESSGLRAGVEDQQQAPVFIPALEQATKEQDEPTIINPQQSHETQLKAQNKPHF